MSLYKLFKTDENLETDGIWLDYGQNLKGQSIRIRIARAGGRNAAFAKALEKATRPYRKALQTGAMDTKIADRIYREVFVDTVVRDWTGVEDQNGEPLQFNRENALKLFEDLPDLYNDVREQASNVALFREEILETDLGNSGGSCSTDSSKAP